MANPRASLLGHLSGILFGFIYCAIVRQDSVFALLFWWAEYLPQVFRLKEGDLIELSWAPPGRNVGVMVEDWNPEDSHIYATMRHSGKNKRIPVEKLHDVKKLGESYNHRYKILKKGQGFRKGAIVMFEDNPEDHEQETVGKKTVKGDLIKHKRFVGHITKVDKKKKRVLLQGDGSLSEVSRWVQFGEQVTVKRDARDFLVKQEQASAEGKPKRKRKKNQKKKR